MQEVEKRGFGPFRAVKAIGRLLRDPSDTAQVFEVFGAIGAPSVHHHIRTLRTTPQGQALLKDRPSLADALAGSKAEDFAPGTLGHEYHRFLAREGITTEGLVSMAPAGHDKLHGDARYFADRIVAQHDLWHVLTGYHGDIIGETCLLAFTARQTGNPAAAALVAMLYLVGGRKLGARGMIRDAYRRAGTAEHLAVVRWEEHLHTPLDVLRRELGLGEPPAYTPVRPEQLGPRGMFGPIDATSSSSPVGQSFARQ